MSEQIVLSQSSGDRLERTLELLWSIHFDGFNFDYEKYNQHGTCPRPALFKFQKFEDFEN